MFGWTWNNNSIRSGPYTNVGDLLQYLPLFCNFSRSQNIEPFGTQLNRSYEYCTCTCTDGFAKYFILEPDVRDEVLIKGKIQRCGLQFWLEVRKILAGSVLNIARNHAPSDFDRVCGTCQPPLYIAPNSLLSRNKFVLLSCHPALSNPEKNRSLSLHCLLDC